MKNKPKIYFIVLLISVITLILEVFVLKFKGVIGLTLCILSLYFIVASIIRLVRLTRIFNDDFMEKIDILFF